MSAAEESKVRRRKAQPRVTELPVGRWRVSFKGQSRLFGSRAEADALADALAEGAELPPKPPPRPPRAPAPPKRPTPKPQANGKWLGAAKYTFATKEQAEKFIDGAVRLRRQIEEEN